MTDARAVPDEVQVHDSPREPVTDPMLGIDVPPCAGRPGEAPAGDGGRLADPRVHERGGAPHRPVVAGHRRLRARPDRRGVHLPHLRVAHGPGRPAARPRAARPRLRGALRGRARPLGDRAGRVLAALLHGRRRGLLGARPRGRRPGHRGAVRQHGGLRLGPARPQLRDRDHGRRPDPAPDEGRLPGPARRAPPGPRGLAGPPAGPPGQPRPVGPRGRDRHEQGGRGRGDPRRRAGVQQRAGLRAHPRPRLDPRRLRRPVPRGTAHGAPRLQRLASAARSRPTGRCSSSGCVRSLPST